MSCKSLTKDPEMISTVISAAEKAVRPISDEEEYYVGRAVAARIISSFPLSKDMGLNRYLNVVGRTVAMHSDRPHTHGGYHFAVLDSDEINAFACPGGIVFVTRGMVKTTKNEDELAAVLAHEVAHVSSRDGISAIKSSRWTEALTIIGVKAAKKYSSEEVSRLVSIFEGSIDDIFKTLVVNGYSQSQEYKADETASAYLSKAGYNPQAAKDFLERLASQGTASGGGVMKTHPATNDRIENLKNKIPSQTADASVLFRREMRFIKTVSYGLESVPAGPAEGMGKKTVAQPSGTKEKRATGMSQTAAARDEINMPLDYNLRGWNVMLESIEVLDNKAIALNFSVTNNTGKAKAVSVPKKGSSVYLTDNLGNKSQLTGFKGIGTKTIVANGKTVRYSYFFPALNKGATSFSFTEGKFVFRDIRLNNP